MSGQPLGKNSARVRLVFALLFFLAFTFLLVAALPSTSKATRESGQSGSSRKRTRPEFVPGDVLVRYRSESVAKRLTTASTLSVEGRDIAIQVERFEGSEIVPGLRVARVKPEETLAAIEALKKEPDVLYAEPNYLLYLDVTPNDPRFTSGELYGLSMIGAPQAWNTTTGSSSIVVGVIDEGIDKNHPDLQANIWTNPAEIPGNGIDDDGNGFIDDVNGYNFATNSGTFPAEDHATHVSGTIGAVGNNGTGVVGVNWNVRLMSLKFINGNSGNTLNAIRACNYAKQMRDLWVSSGGTKGANLRVLNNSYGGGSFEQSFFDAINSLNQSGILFVAAAGNRDDPSDDGNNELVPHYPSSYPAPNVIAVAATTQSDDLASFSHFGIQSVQIGAPGAGILSTTANNTYTIFNGTSMSTPHVAGAAALLLAANPNLTVQQLKSLLIFNGDLVPSLAGKTLTGRRLNVANSFQAMAENDVTPPGTVVNFHLNFQNGRALNVGWIASGDDGAAGKAALYQLTFTDTTTGTVVPLTNSIPGTPGDSQTVDVKLPYRHTSGTLTLHEFDNVGNEGTPATVTVSVSPEEGDPYLTSLGSPASLTTGGTPLNLIADDGIKSNFSLPFAFPFFGQNFSSVNITTNGNLFFSTPPTRPNGDADDVPSSAVGMTQFKMISGLWDDLRTDRRAGDDVYVTSDSNHIIFRWQGVTFGDGTPATEFPVNFEIELRSNGTILTRYGAGNTNIFPVVGISGGEPEAYVIPSHTSEQVLTSLTNAQEVAFLPRANAVLSNVQFAFPQFDVQETGGAATITVTRSGDTSTQATIDYVTTDGSATQKEDYMFGVGRLSFAAGEINKSFTIPIIDDSYQEGTESFSVVLSNPVGTTVGARSVAEVKIFDNDFSPPTTNPLDNIDALFFVRQHYIDFLNREPDARGLSFWSDQITECQQPGATCSAEVRRINVSAAFFISIEFQETGYLVYRMYKAAYGNLSGLPVPVRYGEFLPDTQQIGRGVVVNVGDWETQLENNKRAFAADFVLRSRFFALYPTTKTPEEFVNALYLNAGITPSPAERAAAINEFGTATTTLDTAARARALRHVAENSILAQQEFNKAFVLMQYFGYLRRNPDDPPEPGLNFDGYNFWLGKLNQFGGNFINAEMVKAFIVSGEYRQRFGP